MNTNTTIAKQLVETAAAAVRDPKIDILGKVDKFQTALQVTLKCCYQTQVPELEVVDLLDWLGDVACGLDGQLSELCGTLYSKIEANQTK